MSLPTAVSKTPLGRRSFNDSTADFLQQRRGVEPGTVWGLRAVEALKPWEEAEVCLSHAVAQALEAAYQEGLSGGKPRRPDVRETLRPGDHAPTEQAVCDDCPTPVPPARIVRTLANLGPASPAQPATPAKQGIKRAVAPRATAHSVTQPPARTTEGRTVSYTKVTRALPTRAITPTRTTRK